LRVEVQVRGLVLGLNLVCRIAEIKDWGWGFGMRAEGLGFGVWGSGFWAWL